MSTTYQPSNPTDRRHSCPRARTVHDLIVRTPKLTFFLNIHVKPTSLSQLTREQRSCSVCDRPMCAKIHDSPSASPRPLPSRGLALVKCLPNPAPPGRTTCLPDHSPTTCRQPNTPEQPPLGTLPNVCPNHAMCEIPVKVMIPGCGHAFGHRCLGEMILLGRCTCPTCGTLWYDVVIGDKRLSVLREAWPWRTTRLPIAGSEGTLV